MATKLDLEALETNLELKLEMRIQQVESRIEQVDTRLQSQIQQLEYRLIIKIGTILVIGFTTMATLLKFWLR